MAITLPLPIRVAAGILATGIDVVRSLPADIPAIPVTLVGNAMRLSMRVQQEITTLATRGDELLGAVIGGRPQESPAWAKFDDEEPAPAATSSVRRTSSKPVEGPESAPESSGAEGGGRTTRRAPRAASATTSLHTPGATAMPPVDTTATVAAREVADAVVEQATHVPETTARREATAQPEPSPQPEPTGPPTPTASGNGTRTAATTAAAAINGAVTASASELATDPERDLASNSTPELATDPERDPASNSTPELATDPERDPASNPTPELGTDPERHGAADSAPDESRRTSAAGPAAPQTSARPDPDPESTGPQALPGYDRMTLAQVRGHLRELTADDVSALLRHEQAGDNRAPFLTLLSNRLVTLDAQSS